MGKIINYDLMLFLSGELEQAAEKICVTDSGATPNKPCIFPFKFNGVLYNECTWTSAHLTEHKPWCSTFVDETGERSIFLIIISNQLFAKAGLPDFIKPNFFISKILFSKYI